MKTATAMFHAPAATPIALDLASNMLGLLVNGPNAPIQRIVREGLMDDDGKLASELWNALVEASTTREISGAVASYVGFILRESVQVAQSRIGAS